jgi:hypothetical protein
MLPPCILEPRARAGISPLWGRGQLVAHLPRWGMVQAAATYAIESAKSPQSTPTPPLKLAALVVHLRACSRLQLTSRLRLAPASSTASTCPLKSSAHPTTSSRSFASQPKRLCEESGTRSKYRPRLAVARSLGSALQKRGCQSEVTSSFANMASDRDILPAWLAYTEAQLSLKLSYMF